jgi:hypothetical protein
VEAEPGVDSRPLRRGSARCRDGSFCTPRTGGSAMLDLVTLLLVLLLVLLTWGLIRLCEKV